MISYIYKVAVVYSCCIAVVLAGGAPSETTHQVGIGDSLESIARKYAGHERYSEVIKTMNPHIETTGLQIGDYLFVPDTFVSREPKKSRQALPNTSRQINKWVVVAGPQHGLAHIYRDGGFKIVAAPVGEK